MILYDRVKPILKRVPTIVDVTEDVQRFDLDNLYPQRVDEIVKWSRTLMACLSRKTDFINGEGFQDPIIATLKLNTLGLDGETANDVLVKVSETVALWGKTISLHVNYNLNYKICSVVPVPFSYQRFEVKDSTGAVRHILYSTNWERDGRKDTQARKVIPYYTFNPDPVVVAAQMAECGGIDMYKGQMIFITPQAWVYPLATCNAVLDHAQAEAELAQYKVAVTQNKFLADLGIVYPGEFETEKEKAAFEELIEGKSGAKNAHKRIGIQDKTGKLKASDIFTVLNPANNDKIYEYTETSSSEAITENYTVPPVLMGKNPEGTLFSQDNMESAYTYFNSTCRNDRAFISRVFSKILQHWETPILNPCIIKPQQYIQDGAAGGPGVEVRDNLANMSGRQAQNMGRIIRKFAKGEYSYEQAKVLLQGGFGLSNEEIDKLLGIDEETPPATPPAA